MNKPSEEELEKLNARIAELCGAPKTQKRWRFDYSSGGAWITCAGWATHEGASQEQADLRRRGHQVTAPEPYDSPSKAKNYTRSLDAMHEAVATLGDGPSCEYMMHLYRLSGDNAVPTEALVFEVVEAPAWMRAIALDRALSDRPLL